MRGSNDGIWVARVVESPRPFRVKHPLLASMIKFGLWGDVGFAYFLFRRHNELTQAAIVGDLFALLWLNIGPCLIWYYQRRLLPTFFRDVRDIIPNHERLRTVESHAGGDFGRN